MAERDASGRAALHARSTSSTPPRTIRAPRMWRSTAINSTTSARTSTRRRTSAAHGSPSSAACQSAASSGRSGKIRSRRTCSSPAPRLRVYYSPDGGAHWQPLQLNMPVVPITDLTVKNDDLVAATQGRAFWVLDDITPLRALDDGGDDGATVPAAGRLALATSGLRPRRRAASGRIRPLAPSSPTSCQPHSR